MKTFDQQIRDLADENFSRMVAGLHGDAASLRTALIDQRVADWAFYEAQRAAMWLLLTDDEINAIATWTLFFLSTEGGILPEAPHE